MRGLRLKLGEDQFMICTFLVHYLYIICTQNVYSMYIICTFNVHRMYIIYTFYVISLDWINLHKDILQLSALKISSGKRVIEHQNLNCTLITIA